MSDTEELDLIEELIANGESQTVDFKRKEIISNPTEIETNGSFCKFEWRSNPNWSL